jgi:hypothetical protein
VETVVPMFTEMLVCPSRHACHTRARNTAEIFNSAWLCGHHKLRRYRQKVLTAGLKNRK